MKKGKTILESYFHISNNNNNTLQQQESIIQEIKLKIITSRPMSEETKRIFALDQVDIVPAYTILPKPIVDWCKRTKLLQYCPP